MTQMTKEQIDTLQNALAIERQTNVDLMTDLGGLRHLLAEYKLVSAELQNRLSAALAQIQGKPADAPPPPVTGPVAAPPLEPPADTAVSSPVDTVAFEPASETPAQS